MSTTLRERLTGRGSADTGWFDDLLLAAVVLLLAAPVMQPLMAQQASRYTLTAAMWDDGTIVLNDYIESISVDYAIRDNLLLSDKAPGQPVLALPAYAIYRSLGGEPGVVYRPWGNLGLWLVSVWCAAIPAAVLAILMRRRGLGLGWSPPVATLTALGISTATMLLPFSTQLFSHVLSAALVYGALYVLRTRRSAVGVLAAGTLAAVAVTTEYTAALAGVVLFGVALVQERLRSVWFLLGGVLPAVGLGVYHTVAFGGPFVTGYRFSGYSELHAEGFFGVNPPDPAMLLEVLLGGRGLLVLTPLVMVGIVGCIAVVRTRTLHGDRGADGAPSAGGAAGDAAAGDAVVGLVTTALYVLMMGGWSNATGGASPGPRYVLPALPFLVPGVAHAFARWPEAAWATTVVGWITMGLATFTLPLAPREEPFALGWWWERFANGELADTVLERFVAPGTIFVPVVLAALLAVALVARQRGTSSAPGARP